MQVQYRADSHIQSDAATGDWVQRTVTTALARYAEQVSRVEVHVSEAAAGHTPRVLVCALEVRLNGHPPVAVSHQGSTLTHALEGAADKATRVLESTLAKLARA